MPESVLIIACGALAREITALQRTHGWSHVQLQCLDARLHNRPALIPARLRERIRANRDRFDHIFAAYADCGTGGAIDRVLAEEGVERLPGAHCYQFFAGAERLEALSASEPGTFFLTDFLARHFERLVIRPLQIDRHPELLEAYFGNYRRLVYLSQVPDDTLLAAAQAAARRLGLGFEHLNCGYGELETVLQVQVGGYRRAQEDHHLLA